MNSVNRASGEVSISVLCDEIKAFIDRGDAALKRSEDCYLSAGCCLAELKKREPDEWLNLAYNSIGIGKTRAYELLAIAEGRTTVEETRARTGKRTKRARAKKKNPLRSGRDKAEEKSDDTREDGIQRRQGEKLAMQLYRFIEERFKPSVLEWTDDGERKLIPAVRDDLVDMIEGMAISLQDLAETIRHDPDAAAPQAAATGSRSRPQRPVTGEARA